MSELSLLIDIQSGLVRGALVLNKGQNPPHILYVVTRSIPRKIHTNSTYITKMMLNALSTVSNLLGNEGLSRAKTLGYSRESLNSINFILSSPWILAQSRKAQVVFEKDTLITEKVIHDIVNTEQNQLEKIFEEENLNKELSADSIFIEKKILEVKLNGYSVNNYEKQKARNLEITFVSSLSSKKILEKIHNVVEKNIRVSRIYHNSALLLHFMALQLLFPPRDDYISIHVHSELTDLVIVKNSMCDKLASFPCGTSTLLRQISHTLKHSVETSDSLLTLYQNNNFDHSENKKVEIAIDSIIKTWQSQFIKTIAQRGDIIVLPRTIYLSAHNYFDIFKNILTINSEQQFNIIPFDQSLVESHVVFEKTSEKSQLIGMYALALKNMI